MTPFDGALGRSWHEVRGYVRERGFRSAVREVVGAFERNDLLTYASAISYQLLFALIPSLLAAVAVLGFLDLEDVWRNELVPELGDRLSEPALELLNDTVTQVLTTQRGYWLTFGVLFALWQVSGAVRAAIGALNAIYEVEEDRSFVNRLLVSIACAAIFFVGVAIAVVALQVAPRLAVAADGGWAHWLARGVGWVVAFVVLVALSAILLRLAPATPQPAPWLGFVTAVVVAGWLVTSALFASWIAWVVSYSAVYGSFAAVILLMTYLYLLAVVFLAGVQLDALVRKTSD